MPKTKQTRSDDPATRYANRVVNGDIIAGPHVRAQCRRHLDDLSRSDLSWQPDIAAAVETWISDVLRHPTGVARGQPFHLLPWQQFIHYSIFGWHKQDGSRRFHTAYIETGKGSGKSPLAAAYLLVMLAFDGRQYGQESTRGAQCYLLARDFQQGLVPMRYAEEFIRASPSRKIRRKLRVMGGTKPDRIVYREALARAELVSGKVEGKGASGPLPSFVLVEEYHEHESSDMRDRLWQGRKSVQNPLQLIITNAGVMLNKEGATPCYEEHQYATSVANGEVEDDEYFAYICALDDGDEKMLFDDERENDVDMKTNPSLPLLPGQEYIDSERKSAIGRPSYQSQVKRFIYCRWVHAASPWLSDEALAGAWIDALPDDDFLAECTLYLAADLSITDDLTSVAGYFYHDPTKTGYLSVKSWLPAEGLKERSAREQVKYDEWVKSGDIEAIPGPVINLAYIAAHIRAQRDKHRVEHLAFDAYRMNVLEMDLRAVGIKTTKIPKYAGPGPERRLLIVPHRQGMVAGPSEVVTDKNPRLYMPLSMDLFERDLLDGKLKLVRNAPLNMAIHGAMVRQNPSGDRMLDKKASQTKIDPAVAGVMAVGGRQMVEAQRSTLLEVAQDAAA